jgi:hypothetical protein
MKQYCPNCGAKLAIPPTYSGKEVVCPRCHKEFTPRATVALASKSARLKPVKDHSIYAWFVGLPCGICLIALSLAIVVPVGYYMYDRYEAKVRAEQMAAEEASRQLAELEARERLAKDEAEQKRLREERQLEEARQDKLRADQREREEQQRKADVEKERIAAQERTAIHQAQLERERLAREAEQQKVREAKERLDRADREAKEQIERDHDEILAYARKNVPVIKRMKDLSWHAPVNGIYNKKTGRIYWVSGSIRTINSNLQQETANLAYFFFMREGSVLEYEKADDYASLKKFKAD